MNVTVIGAGAWGTALARLLCISGNAVTIWGHDPAKLEAFRRARENKRYLAGILIAGDWKVEPDLARACANSDCVVVAVPSKAFREVTALAPDFAGVAVSVTKGIECDTALTMCGVLQETMPRATPVALSGPTLALEVARDIPTAIVAASESADAAAIVQGLFHRPTFRVYTSTDTLGVELGGALKNIIAIAAGLCDGLGLGDNSKAALLTRGIAEMRRLGVARGARAETFAGLSGLGDLAVTCFSKLSRNRTLGERLGRGERLPDILSSVPTVAEGYPTARSAFQMADKLQVYTPIIHEAHALLHEGKGVAQAVHDLLVRESKSEDE